MKILITGANGFIGKNVAADFENIHQIFKYDINNSFDELSEFIKEADFIIHLAGVNRPVNEKEFETGNKEFTEILVDRIKKHNKRIPILMTSSIHADKDNAYGKSKKAAEEALIKYSKENETDVYIYRLPNVFGKWCRPNYNSVVATFCYNISHNLPIQVNDPEYMLPLVYIDDILDEIKQALANNANKKEDGYCYIPVTYQIKLKDLADLLYSFKESRTSLTIPNMNNELEKKLHATYTSFLDKDDFKYPLKMNIDHRGSFSEFIRTINNGQVSVNVSKPGITKGNHWHHTKNEKFLVVYGKALIQFRNINDSEIIEYYVSGENLEVVDIPVGYTHNITNIGDTDLVTIMWANECFDPNHPDTFFKEVKK